MERSLDPARLGDHLDRLYRAAWALCGSREDAEDLVQETYARLLARPRLLRSEDDLGYLLRALRNTFLNQKRTESRRLRPDPLPDQLELVARLELADEVRRHLAVVEALDREHEVRVLGSRCDRVAPLGLVAVLSRQPNVDVLAGTVARPLRRVEDDAANSRRLVDEFDDVRELPRQSPQYRCSRHGSP